MQIEHLNKETTDGTVRNLDALYQLFPSCFTEAPDALGKVHRAVDWGKLRELLGEYVEDGEPEKYDFTWVGKRAAQREAAAPCRKTLRPCPEESVDWDTTQNLYIEGDNLEVLKLLQNSYMGKVKMIYIDPPYNTGNDFVYHDDFAQSAEEYDEHNLDDEGNRYRKNTDSNGRFHSDWCSMIYTRLMVARSLLTEDGVIFISIDDNEVDNLRKICDEVFGADNFINCIAVKMSEASGVKMNHQRRRFPKIKEYLLFYKRNSFNMFCKIDKYKQETWDKENNIFLEGINKEDRQKLIEYEEKGSYTTNDIDTINSLLAKANRVSLSQKIKNLGLQGDAIEKWLFENSHCIIKTAGSSSLAKLVKSIDVIPDQEIACALSNDGVLFYYITDFNRDTTQPRLQVIFADSNIFKNPCDFWQDIKTTGAIANEGGVLYKNGKKPLQLLNRVVKMTTEKDDIIIDFFAGSSTTAHSIILNNNLDGNKRKYVMVQLPEDLDESFMSATGETKTDIKNQIKFLDDIGKPHLLTELGKERIRRAGKKIKADSPLTTQDLDIGFRVLKCDESNYKPVAFAPKDYTQESLDMFLDNIKEERTGLDLLFDCMMRWGLELSLPYETQKVDGCTIYNVDEGSLVACFDGVVTSAVIDAIAETHPLRVVFRDSSFTEAAQKMNLFELFKQKCGWTDQEVQNNVRVI